MPEIADVESLSGLELLQVMSRLTPPPSNIGDLIGMQIDSVEFGKVTVSLDTRDDMRNPLGTLHGGICSTLLDSAMGSAIHSSLPSGVSYGTLELKVNFVRSVSTDGRRLVATGKTIHVGRRTATAEGYVYDRDSDKLVAHGTTTCIIHAATGGN